eukprot:XP_007115372.1 protein BEX4-like [Physeter catodon]
MHKEKLVELPTGTRPNLTVDQAVARCLLGPCGSVGRGRPPKVGGAGGAGLRVKGSRRHTCSKNRKEQETANIGPGATASKEEQAVKNLNMENTQQEKGGGDQAPLQNGEESHDLGVGRGQKPGGNVRLGRVRRLVPNFRWAIPSRHIDHNEVGDDVEKHVGQMMEIRRKTKKQQMRHHVRYQTPEPDNHYEFCLYLES